ncbi:hypothetical protein CARUB_v10007750mg [Capsella rubella]|uniref:Arf-GAP domain-containing protein n=1 Tax=Capsella rubella TaxID=81985 RepID=R0GQC9_9BRAS|nr:probable ADP-ribosylation factor GTPase-activating protein AGD14 [Capsella rubella]XP_023634784.1 probable ADP-ribosylation factor GTPase-activating protein AGD14 [Capsella rubella]EOA19084.1 hypothetical protein CARUB_v10007750mg [Capsella rubella]
MASRVKEDEKNERIIRSLLKLPENKRCINCNSLGPQYVCTTFWTFVCTNCSGIHREFTHRVKSVSMAKFTSQEVTSLKEGGNQHAKDIYFKGLDQQRQSVPDGSNVERLRDFIRHVYVNKRYTNEKNDDKLPSETRSSSGSRSPPYEDVNDRRYSDRSSPGGRSPGFEPGNRNVGNNKKSPARPEILNDWRREDRFGGRKTSDEGSQSPEQVKDLGSASPPVARPVREILGDSVIPLRVGEPPKPPVSRNIDASAHAKSTTSLSSLMSTNEKPPEVKLPEVKPPEVKPKATLSLIDFDTDFEPPAPAVAMQAPESTTRQPAPQPASLSNDNWASFDAAPSAPSLNVSQPPPSGNTLDSLLSQLAVTSSVQGQTYTPSSGPGHLGHSTSQIFAPFPNEHSSEQPWNTALASNVHRSMSAPSLQPLQGVPSGGLQSSEVKPSGRNELPADLFTVTYPSYHAPVPGWQAGPPHGMHYGMQQYNNPVPYQNVPHPAKSMNPFDFSTGPPSQTPTENMFPSMAPQQGALPPSGMMPSHGVHNQLPPSGMMPSQGVHNHFNIPSQVSAHPSAMPPRYMSPPLPGSMPPSNVSPVGDMNASYDAQQTYQNFGSSFPAAVPLNPPSFQSGGNPFG